MLHLLQQCDGHHELHDRDEVGQYKIFKATQSINNFLSWKVQKTNSEKEKTMVIWNQTKYMIPPSSFVAPKVQACTMD